MAILSICFDGSLIDLLIEYWASCLKVNLECWACAEEHLKPNCELFTAPKIPLAHERLERPGIHVNPHDNSGVCPYFCLLKFPTTNSTLEKEKNVYL